MKLVLSRKGFDSKFGGGPSLILPDGRMLSLPIPERSPNKGAGVPYASLRVNPSMTYLDIGRQLGYNRNGILSDAHLDPDLDHGLTWRPPDWRPLFGQAGAAQGHLENEGLSPGDLFLFFGLFRMTEWKSSETLGWARNSPRFHALFGYLQIGEIVKVDHSTWLRMPWPREHPHLRDVDRKGNTVYVAAPVLDSLSLNLPGAGNLRWDQRLCLTRPGDTPSVWTLPSCFAPERASMSYHRKPQRWSRSPDGTWCLRTVGVGQEFVIEADDACREWASQLISNSFEADLPSSYTSATERVGRANFAQGTGEMVALDTAIGRQLWSTKLAQIPLGGATVANDLVFTTTLTGDLIALSRKDGSIIWTSLLPAGSNAPLAIWGSTLLAGAGLPLSTTQHPVVVAYRLGG